jgi:hypothetical protein
MIGKPEIEYKSGKQIVVVKLKVNVYTKALSIEEMIGKRKRFLEEILDNFLKELKFDLNILQLQFPDHMKKECLEKMCKEIQSVKTQDCSWFNEDENFKTVLEGALQLKETLLIEILSNWQKQPERLREKDTEKEVRWVT